jgi:DNA-binding NtrC family response regulator
MELIVKVLVLDDRPEAAKESILLSLGPIAVSPGLTESTVPCFWQVTLKNQVFTVECQFINQLAEARNYLLNSENINEYDLILLDNDWEMGGGIQGEGIHGGMDGLQLLEEMSKLNLQFPNLAIYTQATGYRQEYVSMALNWGARALIYKSEPTHFLNVLFASASYAFQKQEIAELSRKVGSLRERQVQFADAMANVEPRLKTKSQLMRDCLVDAARYAITPDIPVFLIGATGSGKEVLARAMHKISPRRDRIFEVLDCTTITKELAESILFGHEKGAFTGAQGARQGIFEIANGGTLLIDEVDALSLDLQSKLLRIAEYGEYRRVGGSKTLYSDCRLLVATNKDIHQLVEKEKFREDLYARLNVGAIRIPSLNERREDIQGIAQYFLKEFIERNKQESIKLSDKALLVLQNHNWKFNIRELRATIFRSALMRTSQVLNAEDILFDRFSMGEEIDSNTTQPPMAISYSLLMDILTNAPRQGSQRKILNLLLEKYPAWVSNDELLKVMTPSIEEEKSIGALWTSISRLNKSLENYIYIENDRAKKCYRIAQLSSG